MHRTLFAASLVLAGTVVASPAWAGEVVVPEPSALALLLTAGGGLYAVKRLLGR